MCDTLCVRSGGAMLFAKNSDRHPDEPQVVEWHARRAPGTRAGLRTQYLTLDDPGAHAFVGSRPTWLWGVEHGVNEFGVAIGNEKIWTVDRPRDRPATLLGMDLVRLGLERAATAEEAVSVITTLVERHGQGGSGEPHRDEPYDSSFLVADPTGGFVVETCNRSWVARPVGAGAAISNRVSVSTDWTRASANIAPSTDFDTFRWSRMPTAHADQRLAVTTAAIGADRVPTVADLARVLRSHGVARSADELPEALDDEANGFSVCMHRPELHSQTTASLIAELSASTPPRVWVALGNPCCSVYVPGFPPAVPAELAAASEWERFARLRNRVEATPGDLAGVRATLGAVEAELWAAADTAHASGLQADLDAYIGTAYRPVADALHRLGV